MPNKNNNKKKKGGGKKEKQAVPVSKGKAVRPSRSPETPVYHMTPCGRDYFRALNMPFEPNLAPCIPSGMPMPSMKFRSLARGTFSTNAGGAGGVAMWPFRGYGRDLSNSSVGAPSRAPFVASTASAWAGSSADYSFVNQSHGTPDAGVWTGVNLTGGVSSPFLAADFGQVGAPTYRSLKLVAAGLRVRYMGPVISTGGRYIVFRNPQPGSTVAATVDGVAGLLGLQAAATQRVTDDWVEVTYRPLIETDLAAVQDPGALFGNSSAITDRLAAGIFLDGLPSQTLEYEAVAYFEAAGTGVVTTPSMADPHTLALTVAATPTMVNPNPNTAHQQAVTSLYQAVRDMGYAGIRGLGNIAGMPAVNRAILNAARAVGERMYGRAGQQYLE